MRYWDTSSVVPLFLDQRGSTSACRKLHAEEGMIATWAFTVTEARAGLQAAVRSRKFSRAEVARARKRFVNVMKALRPFRLDLVLRVRQEADRLIDTYPLESGDALQLGAAVVAVDHKPHRHEFVCGDKRLSYAVEDEGFTLRWTGDRPLPPRPDGWPNHWEPDAVERPRR